jgi:hypothetical protein
VEPGNDSRSRDHRESTSRPTAGTTTSEYNGIKRHSAGIRIEGRREFTVRIPHGSEAKKEGGYEGERESHNKAPKDTK